MEIRLLTLLPRKPRNPIVAHAWFRRAGEHRRGAGSMRQRANRQLKRELDRLAKGPP